MNTSWKNGAGAALTNRCPAATAEACSGAECRLTPRTLARRHRATRSLRGPAGPGLPGADGSRRYYVCLRDLPRPPQPPAGPPGGRIPSGARSSPRRHIGASACGVVSPSVWGKVQCPEGKGTIEGGAQETVQPPVAAWRCGPRSCGAGGMKGSGQGLRRDQRRTRAAAREERLDHDRSEVDTELSASRGNAAQHLVTEDADQRTALLHVLSIVHRRAQGAF